MSGLFLLGCFFLSPGESARLDLSQVAKELTPLCREDIVDETCELLSAGRNVFQRAPGGKVSVLSLGELQGALHTTLDSLASYMDFIDLDPHHAGPFMVSCMELLTLWSFMVVGYTTDAGVVCDVDVSDAGFSDVSFDTENSDGTNKFERSRAVKAVTVQVGNDTVWSPDLESVDPEDRDDMPENVGLDQLRISVANLFRIFPPFEMEDGAGSFLQEGTRISNDDCFDAVPGAQLRKTSFWLTISFSGRKCKCPKGTVLTGGKRCRSSKYVEDRRKFDPDELSGSRCFCRAEDEVRENIPPPCADKFPTGFKDYLGRRKTCKQLKTMCHERRVYEVCPSTCHSTCLLDGGGDDDKEDLVEPQAQAYAMKAIRAMGSGRKATKYVKRWFGENDQLTREKVLRVINGIHRLLSNADYIYPAKDCDRTTLAYVYPKPPGNRNLRGRYVFHLCRSFMDASNSGQIETLTHEASHHETMYTDDICADGGSWKGCPKAYGRPACARLARIYPDEAQNNADNYCFFINDVATGRW
ncbi:Peptidyl-Lys metalloendopeptidase [Symbiodinium microadriaticum]|uniref:Peptidyl-Lys metalloendopeptidase n=1 Tax=Symbiodinium microadriaticum TaxID=2951 RepID=A0A1Q9EZZ8_SYMMI|nr:Peptidyl-Lys metalloendopeptidase [Symbiodinium microadriaticum]